MESRILIVGTVPYNKKSTSRAFDSYFHNWNKENLAQIFSNTKTPIKGHCSTLYQITDQRLFKRRFLRSVKTGLIYNYEDLPNEWSDNSLEIKNSFINKLYKFGSRKNSLVYLARKIIWKKKYWCTKELNEWLDKFNPQCVFLSFSDDFFISEIAIYVAEKYNIPIISSIGDDYYFNYNFSFSLLYHFYKLMYRKLIRKVFDHRGSAIYIGNKIRDRYNSEFNINGVTIYLTSAIERRDFHFVNTISPKISYFGNIRLGRNKSLNEIGNALGFINKDYILDIYSNENDPKYYKLFKKNSNIIFHGSISYNEVKQKTVNSDVIIIVEGFKKKDVNITRYSLSTKVADALASGANVFAYGSIECGAIEYVQNIDAVQVCSNKNELRKKLEELLFNTNLEQKYYNNAIEITNNYHNLEKSNLIFSKLVEETLNREE